MSPLSTGSAVLDRLATRSTTSVQDRVNRVRAAALPVAQSTVAAGIAWFLASRIPGHPAPYFAPIAAVIALGVALGQRTRRAVEIAVGVAVGVFVGDVLVVLIGVGTWQLMIAVAGAMVGALFVGGSVLLVSQAASSAVLIVALTLPRHSAIQYNRFIDAVIGGAVAIVVNALLLPLNPLTVVRRTSEPLVASLVSRLRELAAAIDDVDADAARDVLTRLRDGESLLRNFESAIAAGAETAALSPVRWRARGQLSLYTDASVHLDRFVRNLRVCARRIAHLLSESETPVPELAAALTELSDGVWHLHDELKNVTEPSGSRRSAIEAVEKVSPLLQTDPGLDVTVAIAQIRSMAIDLLRATGVDNDDALLAVKVAGGEGGEDALEDDDE